MFSSDRILGAGVEKIVGVCDVVVTTNLKNYFSQILNEIV